MNLRQDFGLAAMSLALATAGGLNALAADPGVVATAPIGTGAPVVSAAQPANATTGAQIDSWVASDGGASQAEPNEPAPRTIHGEVSAGVGTGGYRDVSGVADIPVGQTGDLVVAASSTSGQVRGGRYRGYGLGGDTLALGYYANGAPAGAPGCGHQVWGPPQVQTYAAPGSMDCSGPPAP